MHKVEKASIGGLVALIVFAGVAAAQINGRSETQIAGDFRNAAVAEVQDSRFSIEGLNPDTEVVLLIDGQRVTSAKTDRRGRLDLELTVRAKG